MCICTMLAGVNLLLVILKIIHLILFLKMCSFKIQSRLLTKDPGSKTEGYRYPGTNRRYPLCPQKSRKRSLKKRYEHASKKLITLLESDS